MTLVTAVSALPAPSSTVSRTARAPTPYTSTVGLGPTAVSSQSSRVKVPLLTSMPLVSRASVRWKDSKI